MKDSDKLDVETELDSNTPKEPKKKGNSKVHVLYIFLLLLLGAGGAYLYTLYTESLEKIDVVSENINEVNKEKQALYKDLDSLEADIEGHMGENAKLDSLLNEKQSEITRIRGVLRAQRADIRKVRSLQKQLSVLKKTAKEAMEENLKLRHQVDSLDEVSLDRQKQIDTMEIMDFEKTRKLDSLAEKVNQGANIRVGGLELNPYNRWDNVMSRARRVNYFKVKGTLLENVLAEEGKKTLYIRITAPGGVVLTSDPGNQFKYDGETIMFTERREVTYNKNDVPFEIFYDASNDDLEEGTYKVVVFCNDKEIGKTELSLD
ncbi:MAG: hypothetical protein R6U95_10815 [Bacteroidales bacterium]